MNLTGQTLGDYQLQSLIGRGPRASVYRARQMPVERIVAVKVYDESVDPDVIRRAYDSAQELTHSHVLPAHDFGVHQGLAYVVMRHMPVGSIKSRWRGVVPMADVVRMLPQIASALDHAHQHGLLHLNLKPTNIALDHPGNAFVSDFGVPTQADSPYAAPEITRGGHVDERADVYGLGALLYEMLTGRAPTLRRPRGDGKDNVRMGDLPTPQSIRPDIPQAVQAVVLRAMSIDPESRYATPGALAEAFAQAMQPGEGEKPAAREPVTPPAPARSATALPQWVVPGVIGLLIVGIAVAAALGSNGPTAAPLPSPTVTVESLAATDTPQAPPPTSTPPSTPIPRPATASPTQLEPTASPSPTSSPTSKPSATPTQVFRRILTPAPAFTVKSLVLKPLPARLEQRDRLDLIFDAVVQPSTGGPFGQLFAFLPGFDSLVTTRIGAQVYAGVQLLRVTMIVDCSTREPVTTDQVLLEIRETDRGPALFSQTISYTKTWCR